MTENDQTAAGQEQNTRERIYETSIRLFADKGFAATGMREIAREADVNLAMINYFFGSKHGLLKAILDDFFTGLMEVAETALPGPDPPEVKLRRHLVGAVRYIESKHRHAIILISQLPLNDPKITAFKAEWIQRMLAKMHSEVLSVLETRFGRRLPLYILGPVIISAIVSHYLFKPVMEQLGQREFDQSFYEEYPEIIAQVALGGLFSFSPAGGQAFLAEAGTDEGKTHV